MSLIAKESSGSKFPPIEEGVYVATVYSVVDLGEQYSEKFEKSSRKILITWEIQDLQIEIDGEIFSVYLDNHPIQGYFFSSRYSKR